MRKQAERLADLGIKLVIWDADELSVLLKDAPQLVDDFFGRAWVDAFCGPAVAAGLGQRLDGREASQLRARFAKLYFTIFRSDDPTYPFRDPTTSEAGELAVLPDVVTDSDAVDSPDDSPPRAGGDSSVFSPFALEDDDEALLVPVAPVSTLPVEERSPIVSWLASQDSVVVVGGPGVGKSTLLRLLALDLLAAEPQLEAIGRRWGSYLPVWIPFAYWTALIAQGAPAGAVSFVDAIAAWLKAHGAEDLQRVVVRALQTQELLLLVDGLDEWESPQAARAALALLQSFASHRGVPVIATCRPRAFAVLGRPAHWTVSRIAPLSAPQQMSIAELILSREMSVAEEASSALVGERVRQFMKQIQQQSELSDIARTPLLLGLLAQLWHREAYLPANRFQAYDKLVELLVITHPIRRVTSARGHDEPPTTDTNLRRALAVLALAVMEHHPSGIIARVTASQILEAHFADDDDGLALPAAEAKRLATAVVEHATDRAALLVARSPVDVGFYHRALLEHLAAEALAAKDRGERLAFIADHARAPEWHEVIVTIAALTAAQEDVRLIIDSVRGAQRNGLDRLLTLPLCASVAFTAPACPAKTAREVAREVLEEIETGPYLPIRLGLVDQVVSGLRAGPTQALVKERVKRWLPRRAPYRTSLYRAIATWTPRTDEATECLWKALYDENLGDVREAARALVALAADEPKLLERLKATIRTSPVPRIRAVVADALLTAGNDLALGDLETAAGLYPSGDLAFVAIKGRIKAGRQSTEDFQQMLLFSTWGRAGLDYYWTDELDDVLVSGWGDSDELLDVATRSVLDVGERHIDPRVARRVLVRGFSTRDEVAKLLAAEISSGQPIPDHDIWRLYAAFARESGPVKAAMDAWLPNAGFHNVEAHWAALTTRSDFAKAEMIGGLRRARSSWAAKALIEGWGGSDPEVSAALRAAIDSSTEKACELATVLPDIVSDRDECRARLLALLPDAGFWTDFVTSGLARIRGGAPEPEVVSHILGALATTEDSRTRATLIATWTDDDRVEKLALEYLADPDGELSAVAVGAARAPLLRERVLACVGVLPVRLRLRLAEQLDAWQHNPTATSVLRAYPHEADAAVRTQCAVAHHARAENQGSHAIDLLKREIVKRGFVMAAAREAAFAALLQMGRLDVFVTALESGERAEPLRLRTGWSRGFNGPFWRAVAEHWSLLETTLRDDLFRRVTDSEQGSLETWEALAINAHHSPALTRTVVQRALSIPPEQVGANTLRLLVREHRTTSRVREILIAVMRKGPRAMLWGPDRYDDAAVVAAELLGDRFGSDASTLAAFAPAVPDEGAPPVLPVVAMCVGWPEAAELDAIFEYLYQGNVRLHPVAHGAVVATKSRAERVIEIAQQYGDYIYPLRRTELRVVTRLFVRRLREDDDVFEGASAARTKLSGPSLAVLLRLLVAARGLSDYRAEIEELVRRELDGEVPPMSALDPFTGGLTTASDLLLDGALAR